MSIHSFMRGARSLALRLALSSTVVLLLPASADAQETGAVSGRVVARESSTPIVGAIIHLRGTARATQTDTVGHFRLDGLSIGSHMLEVRRVGYSTQAVGFEITASRMTVIDVVLSDAPSALGTVTVIGTRSDL